MKKFVIRFFVLIYVTTTLPITTVVLVNEHVRRTVLNTASHYRSSVIPLATVHIGDSLTAGTHWKIAGPTSSYNLAGNGYTICQVSKFVGLAKQYRPATVCVMAGTNDILAESFDINLAVQQYEAMLDAINDAKLDCIVTLVPYCSVEFRDRVSALNSAISGLAKCRKIPVIDLNPTIAPEGTLLPAFTSDGVHFSDLAYKLWSDRIRQALD